MPQSPQSLSSAFGSVAKWRTVTAPAEISVHGAQSGAVNTCEPPRPFSGKIVAESITNSSMPSTQANIPEARKKLFHMIVRVRRVGAVILLHKLPGHEETAMVIDQPDQGGSARKRIR